jgi:hypothetical protein
MLVKTLALFQEFRETSTARRVAGLCSRLSRAVSITVRSRSHESYSRATTSGHVGDLNPEISGVRDSTRRLCSCGSEQMISTSTKSAAARFATSTHALRVIARVSRNLRSQCDQGGGCLRQRRSRPDNPHHRATRQRHRIHGRLAQCNRCPRAWRRAAATTPGQSSSFRFLAGRPG